MKVRVFVSAMLLALVLSVSGVFAQDQNIVEIAAGNEDFSTLVSLVEAAGLVETLSGAGPFTVFAPTNDAFAALPGFVVEYLLGHTDVLTQVLTYHVVPGNVMAADVVGLLEENDGRFSVATADMDNEVVIFTDIEGNIRIDGALITTTDIVASNGVIHVIDAVIVPPVALDAVVPSEVEGDIITAGSSTVGPLTRFVADVLFAGDEGYAGEISVDIIGSGAGIERFCVAGESDIANASRGIRDTEIESCASIGREVVEFRVATDALAVVVSAENDFVEDITSEELAMIFSTAQTWSDVRAEWPDENILRFAPGTDSGTHAYFVEEVFDEDPAPLQSASNLQQSELDDVLVQGVQTSPFAVAFFGYAYYISNAEALKVLSIDGVTPTIANVDSGAYPLARPLFIYSSVDVITSKPQVAAFISYYLQNVNAALEDSRNVDALYFTAPSYDLNLSRLELAALLSMAMGM